MASEQPGRTGTPLGTGTVETLSGTGRDGREALAWLLAGLASSTDPVAAEGETEAGEIAVAFRAVGGSIAEVAAAAVAAVLEQQETHGLLTRRIDLDGWIETADGIRAWGFLFGVPDAAPLVAGRGDVVGAPTVTSEEAGITIVVTLGGQDESARWATT